MSGGVRILPGRALLAVGGAEARRFLQGLLTADVGGLAGAAPAGPAAPRCAYSALLSAQGKVLHDVFLHAGCARAEALAGAGGVVLECAEQSAGGLLRALRLRVLRARVEVQRVDRVGAGQQVAVAAAWRGGGGEAWGGDVEGAAMLPRDPRLPELARRGLADGAGAGAGGEGGGERALAAYTAWRHALGVAEGPVELGVGELSALECNLEALGALSFNKGCYLGQEPVARAHHTGVVRKRVMPVALSGGEAAGAQAGDELVVARGGKGRANAAGRLLVAGEGGAGLAMLRLGKALPASAEGGAPLQAASRDYLVAPRVPSWWPEGWRAGG